MFQFPGFALKTLCIQVKSTWFCSLVRTHALNNKQSSGFPHSEIHGSKLILSSPWLIAEYHVFHRLLLPRHSPNALFALDLIQKKSDAVTPTCRHHAGSHGTAFSVQKSYFPAWIHVGAFRLWATLQLLGLVYLTWTTLFVSNQDTLRWSRKRPDPNASPTNVRNQNEINPTLRAIKQCW